jgi:putative FmdB family regulatory protein
VPTYQYACTECGHQLEAVQSFSDDPLTVCPACEGKLRKVFNSVGIVFKGSGFYRTDSRSGAKDAAGGTAPAPAQKSTESTPKDTKPATTPAATSSTTPSSSTSAPAATKA